MAKRKKMHILQKEYATEKKSFIDSKIFYSIFFSKKYISFIQIKKKRRNLSNLFSAFPFHLII